MGHLRLRLLTAVATLLALSFAGGASAAPTELFFSEYLEGTSNNKALEIYNGTGAPSICRAGYSVQMFFNGSDDGRSDDQPHGHGRRGRRLRPGASRRRTPRSSRRPTRPTAPAGSTATTRSCCARARPCRRRSARSASTPAPSGAPASPAPPTTRSAASRRSAPATPTAPTPSTRGRVGRLRDRHLPRARGAHPACRADAGADRRVHQPGGRRSAVSASKHPRRHVQRARERRRLRAFTLACSASGTKTATVTANRRRRFRAQPTTPSSTGTCARSPSSQPA